MSDAANVEYRVALLEKERDERRASEEAWRNEVREHHRRVELAQAMTARDMADGRQKHAEIDRHLESTDSIVESLKEEVAKLCGKIASFARQRRDPHTFWTAVGGAGMGVILGAIELYKAIHP